jgi:hypothetical protein
MRATQPLLWKMVQFDGGSRYINTMIYVKDEGMLDRVLLEPEKKHLA